MTPIELRRKLNSMLYWYPKIGFVPTPKTSFIELPEGWLDWLDSGTPAGFSAKLRKEGEPLGYPLFMRTDQMAAKHNWSETCFVQKEEHLSGQVRNLLEENAMADMVGEAMPSAIALREFLHLETAFKAFKGMPVAREFRLFANDGNPLCIHPYWPPESILFWKGTKEPSDWKTKLAEISKEPRGKDAVELGGLAAQISKTLGGYWSIDCCKTASGVWYVTDMAVGYDSFHWEGCPAKLAEL